MENAYLNFYLYKEYSRKLKFEFLNFLLFFVKNNRLLIIYIYNRSKN